MLSDTKHLLKKLGKFKKKKQSLTTIDTLRSSPGPQATTSTSKIIASTADCMSSVPASAASASARVDQTAGITSDHGLQVSAPVSAPEINDLTRTVHELQVSALAVAPVVHSEEIPLSSHDAIIQANLGSTESEQNPSHSGPGFLANAQTVLITGSTFNYVNIPPANPGEEQAKIPLPQKPSSSPFFTGRKDVLDKLGNIFVHRADSRLMLRRSCLLWGMGGIGKTQICLKFIEDMADNFTHVFWVDASSDESITMSLKGISSIPAAQAFGMDGSVQTTLQWILLGDTRL